MPGLAPRLPHNPLRRPTVAELLELLEAQEIALHSIMTRWEDGVPAELRAEVMVQIYEPALHMLMRAKRRPIPR